jgi:hypothetical protein
MLADLTADGRTLGERKAGVLPYVTLAAGLAVVVIAYVIFWT